MFCESIRRQISALLILSILSSSLTPAFATLNNDDDGSDNEQARYTIQKAVAKASSPLDTIFTNDLHSNVYLECIYKALSPTDRNSLGCVCQKTHNAQKIYERQSTASITVDDLKNHPKLSLRFEKLIVNPLDTEGYFTQEGEDDSSYMITPALVETLDLSKLKYGELTVDEVPTFLSLLQKVSTRANLHVYIKQSLRDQDVDTLIKAFSTTMATLESQNAQTPKEPSMQTPSLLSLNSLRLTIDTGTAAIKVLNFLKIAFNIGDIGDHGWRPTIEIFVKEIVKNCRVILSPNATVKRAITHKDPTLVTSQLTKEDRNTLEALIEEFINFGEAIRKITDFTTLLKEDTHAASMQQGPLLRLTSRSDILNNSFVDEGDDFDVLTAPVLQEFDSHSHVFQLKNLFQLGNSLMERFEFLSSVSDLQPTTLNHVLSLTEGLFTKEQIESRGKIMNSLAYLLPSYRALALACVFPNENKETTEIQGSCVRAGFAQSSTEIFSSDDGSSDETFSCASSNDDEDGSESETDSYVSSTDSEYDELQGKENLIKALQFFSPEDFVAASTLLHRLLEEIEYLPDGFFAEIRRDDRLDVLSHTVSMIETIGWGEEVDDAQEEFWQVRDRKNKTYAALMKAFAALRTPEARKNLMVLATTLPHLNTYSEKVGYLIAASVISEDQRSDTLPLVCDFLKEVKGISISEYAAVAKLICDQNTETRARFVQNLKKLLGGIEQPEGQDPISEFLKNLSDIKTEEQGGVLEKTVAYCGGVDYKDYYQNYQFLPDTLIKSFKVYTKEERAEICALIEGFVSDHRNRSNFLITLAKHPIAEVRDVFTRLDPVRSHFGGESDANKVDPFRTILSVPRNYRSLFFDIADLAERRDIAHRLGYAYYFHKNVTENLAQYPFETQAKVVMALKGLHGLYTGQVFSDFSSLTSDEDPVEIAETMGLLKASYKDVRALPKEQRGALVLKIQDFLSKLTVCPDSPERKPRGGDVLGGLRGVDPSRIPSLLDQGLRILKDDQIVEYHVSEVLKPLAALPADAGGDEIVDALLTLWPRFRESHETMDLRVRTVTSLPKNQRMAFAKKLKAFIEMHFNSFSYSDAIANLSDYFKGVDPQDWTDHLFPIPPSVKGFDFKIVLGVFAKARSLEDRDEILMALNFLPQKGYHYFNEKVIDALLQTPVEKRTLCAKNVRLMTDAAQLRSDPWGSYALSELEELKLTYANLCSLLSDVNVEKWDIVVQSVNEASALKLLEGQNPDPVKTLKDVIQNQKHFIKM